MTRYVNKWMSSGLVLGVFVVLAGSGSACGQGGVIHEDFKLLASDGAADDLFGWSIGIDNGIVAVGARFDDDNGNLSGSAYVFDASTGSQIAKLLPIGGAADDWFGDSIAIDNGIVAVGAWFADYFGSNAGSAYLFDALTGTQIHALHPNDGAANDLFGNSISIKNGIVAVGARWEGDSGSRFRSGSAYLFDATTGVQIAKLIPSDTTTFDEFGFSIAISNSFVVVGARFDDDNGSNSGSAYVFDVATGVQIVKLLPSDGASDDNFGWSVAVGNGIVAVGAYRDDDNGTDSGSVYLFDALTGVQIAKLLPSNGAEFSRFGNSVAIDNGVVAVGEYGNNANGVWAGAAYLFDASNGVEMRKIIASDNAAGDSFSGSIAIGNGVVAAGAYGGDDNGVDSGSAYVFDISCPADINGDWVVDVLDFFAFVTAFAAGDLVVDINGDGAIDVLDFFAFIVEFAGGCP